MSALRSAAGWGNAVDADAPRTGSAGAAAAFVAGALVAGALKDETAPPKSAAIADSKVGPYASLSCRASTTRRNSGIGLRVQQRLPSWNHQQCSAAHVRALLIPQS